METAFAFGRSNVLVTAVELELFTHIDNGEHTIEELARNARASERGLRMLLNVLTAQGFLDKRGERYELTETARLYLSKRSPSYLGGLVRHTLQMQPAWGKLTEAVRTGKPAREVEGEGDQGEFFSQFVDALYALGAPAAGHLARHLLAQLPQRGNQPRDHKKGDDAIHVLDIGAGSGVWGFALAKQNPQVRVTVVDWPKVIDTVTRRFAEREGVHRQVSYLPGNLRTVDFGENQFDVAILGHICHSEGPENTPKLFARLRRAVKTGGQIAVVDHLADEQRASAEFPLLFAINMLVHTESGDTFTLNEYRQWLLEAGFDDVNRLESPGDAALLVARKRAATERAA